MVSVADPGFPRRGTPAPEFGAKTHYLPGSLPFLHEHERNWTEGKGSRVPGAPFFDPPVDIYDDNCLSVDCRTIVQRGGGLALLALGSANDSCSRYGRSELHNMHVFNCHVVNFSCTQKDKCLPCKQTTSRSFAVFCYYLDSNQIYKRTPIDLY